MTKAKLLIVEDEPIIASSLRFTLEKLGYEVLDIIQEGEAVTAYTTRLLPDLVLMDITLRGAMDGIEAAEQLRGLDHEPPVVFLTAHDDETTIKKAAITGPYGYILKPFNQRELHICVETSLYRAQMEKELLKNEAMFRTTLQSLAQPVAIISNELELDFCNFLFRQELDLEDTSGKKTPIEQLFDLSAHPNVLEPIREALQKGRVVSIEKGTLRGKTSGQYSQKMAVVSPIISEQSATLGAVMVLQN